MCGNTTDPEGCGAKELEKALATNCTNEHEMNQEKKTGYGNRVSSTSLSQTGQAVSKHTI
jgi:hypothetical protein